MTKLNLPPGSKHGLHVIDKLSKDQLESISVKLLQMLPNSFVCEELNSQSWLREFSLPKAEFTLVTSTLLTLWKQVALHSFKPNGLTAELGALGFNDQTVDTLVAIWKLHGDETLKRLRNISYSGIPDLREVKWAILLERATSFEPKKREVRALLQLDTDKGTLCSKMDFISLKELHYKLQTIQQRLDLVTKT